MKIFHVKNGKITNIKQNYFSNFSNYKKILSNNHKNNSVDDNINKTNLRKNNKIETDNKKNRLEKTVSNQIIYSNETFQRINEKNFFNNLLMKLTRYKEKKDLKNISFTNNLINKRITQYEENISLSKSQKMNKKLLNENNEDINNLNDINKMINNNKKTKFFLHKNLNIKENLIEDDVGIIKNTNKGTNNFFNNYISKNIINNLNSFNKIKDLIKVYGFTLNTKNLKSGYNEKHLEEEKKYNTIRLVAHKMNGLKKTEKEEIVKSEKKEIYPFIKLSENPGNIAKKISRNIFFPSVKSEDKEKNHKLSFGYNAFKNKNEIQNFKFFNKELLIKREANKFFRKNNYKSLKEFYKDCLKLNKNYLTINDIDSFLNKKLKMPMHVTREEIHKLFFNQVNSEHIDFNDFKNFFSCFEIFDKENEKLNKDNKDEKEKLSKEALVNYEKKILGRILNFKEILFSKLEEKRGSKIFINKDKYLLNYDEFYNLIKNNIISFQDKIFDIVLRKIFADNFDKRKNKMDFLTFIYKINSESKNPIEFEKNVNHSEIDNSIHIKTEKKLFRRINSYKDNLKITFKLKPKEKEEHLFNSESKKSIFKRPDNTIFINNSIEFDYLNNVSKISCLNCNVENRKNKNSDIINII